MHGMIQKEATRNLLAITFALSGRYLFSIFTRRTLVPKELHPFVILCLCNVTFAGLQFDTTLESLSALYCEISAKKYTIMT